MRLCVIWRDTVKLITTVQIVRFRQSGGTAGVVFYHSTYGCSPGQRAFRCGTYQLIMIECDLSRHHPPDCQRYRGGSKLPLFIYFVSFHPQTRRITFNIIF